MEVPQQPPVFISTPWEKIKTNLPSTKGKIATIILALIFICAGIAYYWWYNSHYVSTDDAYVNAHVVRIAAQTTGRVTELSVTNNQYVTQGSLLFKIEPTSTNNPPLNSNYTSVLAPTNGWISNMNLRVGDLVRSDIPLFAFISDEEFWIDANFKETQLRFIKIGQEAQIENDVYPDKKFKGVVESISPASGNAFSLLPSQNATGNWVKIVQRVPVRVRIVEPDPNFPLRLGTSSTVTIRYDQKSLEPVQAGNAR